MIKSVLVTGAGGFLGGWVTEVFHLTGSLRVRAGIRRWNTAVRIARFPVEVVRCDILNPSELDNAMRGMDAVVHCAFGDDRTTIDGTRNVLLAAEKYHVKRIVHISSVAVYGKAVRGDVDEATPPDASGYPYAERKLLAEKECLSHIAHGAPVVILRPTIIYGPFSAPWIVGFADKLRSGSWGTFGEHGEGTCNLVYATDVVQAILAALDTEESIGETFNINGNEIITWNRYFELLNSALGREPLARVNFGSLKLRATLSDPLRRLGGKLLADHRDTIVKMYKSSAIAGKAMKNAESGLRLTPTREQLKLFSLKAHYPIDKAERMLGYSPRIKPRQGVDLSVSWLHHHGLLYSR